MRARVWIAVAVAAFACSKDKAPPVPTDLAQAAITAGTAVPVGDEVCADPILLSASVTSREGSVKLEVEVRPATSALTGQATHSSADVSSGTRATVEIGDLAVGAGYRWAARAVDA